MNAKNKLCVHVDTDTSGLHFMRVVSPEHASVTITEEGDITVNVNDSCVFSLSKPTNIRVDNALPPVRR